MPKSVGFSPNPSFQQGADGPIGTAIVPKSEPTTEVQLKRARLQIAQLKAENIRLRRKVKLAGKAEAAGSGMTSPAHKSIESSLCNMEPSPATSITPMPPKRRLRKAKKPEVAAVTSQPQPPTITPPSIAKPLKVKKAGRRQAKQPEPSGHASNASGEKKTVFRKKVDLVKAQLKKDVETTLKKGSALVEREKVAPKNSKSFKEHIQYLKTEIKG